EDLVSNTCLNDMALAGGAPQAQVPPFYYTARDPAALGTSLMSIVTGLARSVCHIDLRSPTADPASVKILIGGKEVPRDTRSGWSFEPGSSTRITISGSWCGTLQVTDTTDPIAVEVLGCPMATR